MIIIGFPCIGKSSVVKEPFNGYAFSGFIDLESSNFIKDDNWVVEYCKVALDLSSQGYYVFVSSHQSVRDCLSEFQNNDDIIEIFPDSTMQEKWMKRLKDRYDNDPSDKNKRAYDYMSNNFLSSVEEMKGDNIHFKLILNEHSYINDLKREISKFCIINSL